MSRPDEWLPFFEASSTKRDTATWWTHIEKELVEKKVNVIGMVSDRAKALVKLAKPEYLDSFSMPDLFHFMQDYSKSVGSRLASQLAKAQKIVSKTNCKSGDYEILQEDLLKKTKLHKQYKTAREQINKVIHPFDEFDQLTDPEQLDTGLRHLFTKIKSIAQQSNIIITTGQASKILNQIPDLVGGIRHWQNYLNLEIEKLSLNTKQKNWLVNILLPYLYWRFNLSKLCSKENNKEINEYYQKRVEFAQLRYKTLSKNIEITEKQKLLNWGVNIIRSFHRSSSRVEGRNGYLAFMNQANKGIPKQRKKALTIVHNFDMRNNNGTTPAQRLFKRDFPNLFEFILNDLGQLPEPRRRIMKTGIKY